MPSFYFSSLILSCEAVDLHVFNSAKDCSKLTNKVDIVLHI